MELTPGRGVVEGDPDHHVVAADGADAGRARADAGDIEAARGHFEAQLVRVERRRDPADGDGVDGGGEALEDLRSQRLVARLVGLRPPVRDELAVEIDGLG